MAKKNKAVTQISKQKRLSHVLYCLAAVVILVPLLLLGYIYLSAKESAGKPTTGDRFANSLDPEISDELLTQVKEALVYDKAESVEVTLKSATLRVTIDLNDDCGNSDVNTVINDAYKKVTEILPVDTYFTNKEDGTKMYDLDVHVYNFIPEDDNTSGWVYKEKTKNAAASKAVLDTLSSARSKTEANRISEEQKQAAEDEAVQEGQ